MTLIETNEGTRHYQAGTIELKDLPRPARAANALSASGWPASAAPIFSFSRATPASRGSPVTSSSASSSPRRRRTPPGSASASSARSTSAAGDARGARAGSRSTATPHVVGIRSTTAHLPSPVAAGGNLHDVPDAMDDETAVFVEPVAAACRIFEQMAIDDRARVAVVGDGRMGLLVAQVMKTAAPDVTVFGRHERKLAIARALGLDATRSEVPSRSSRSLRRRRRRHRPPRRPAARPGDSFNPRGTVVMKSTFHGEAPIATWPIVVDEVTLLGSRCGPFQSGDRPCWRQAPCTSSRSSHAWRGSRITSPLSPKPGAQ